MASRSVRGVAVAIAVAGWMVGGCESPPNSANHAVLDNGYEMLRRTAVVEVYQACKDSVVNIGCSREDEADPNVRHTEYGSGVILHPAGFVLTNAHLLRKGGDLAVGFAESKDYQAHVIAVDETRDLAVLMLDADRRFKPIRLGRSNGLLVGERVVTMGNPLGMGLTVAEGIVSAIGRSTKSEYTYYPDMIQTDATTNPGSSGGPLLNVSGEMVGINTTKNLKADNIAFAIPADRIRENLPEVLAVEGRYGFVLGIDVATDGPARVTAVTPGSPAAAGGVRIGDVVRSVGTETVTSGLDFHFALVGVEGGTALPIQVLRDGKFVSLAVTPTRVAPRPAAKVTDLVSGLARSHYRGKWQTIPDVSGLKPAKTGTSATFDLGEFAGKDGFALEFTGYIDVPAGGVYGFYTASDDGSRLHVAGQLVVENDGAHPRREVRGFISLAKGKHAIVCTFFEGGGEEALTVSWEGPDFHKVPIPASALFHAKAGE
ncbi:MAG TPA: trypsin-like peptidase domain-containing protein [Phycisphaerae bacterium]|nr:trypsin-like peptidase domain-containing protein [Phycisphaerae bacterium]